MRRGAEEILENVVWFISQLDEETLKDVQNLPVLEMAKAAFLLTQVPLPQRSKIYGALARIIHKGTERNARPCAGSDQE